MRTFGHTTRDLGSAALLAFVLTGCGEDGQGIRDPDQKCVEQPLYQYVDSNGPDTEAAWRARRRHLDGTPFSAQEELALEAKQKSATDGPQRCLSPAGHAITIKPDGGH